MEKRMASTEVLLALAFVCFTGAAFQPVCVVPEQVTGIMLALPDTGAPSNVHTIISTTGQTYAVQETIEVVKNRLGPGVAPEK
jgi:hypothetical protein